MTPPSKQLDDKALEAAKAAHQKALADCTTVACQDDHMEIFLRAYLDHAPASRNAVWNEAIEAAAKKAENYFKQGHGGGNWRRLAFQFPDCIRALRLPEQNEKDQGR